MARPKSISTESILAAAREVLFARGWRASTADIARAAGVSEGTLFKRFATKDELLFAALRLELPEMSDDVTQAMRAGRLREGLEGIAYQVLEFFEHEMLPKVTLHWTHPGFDPRSCFVKADPPPPVVMIRRVRALLRVALGRAEDDEDVTVTIATRMFMASLHQFAWFSMTGVDRFMPMERTEYVLALIDMLCGGLVGAFGPDCAARIAESPLGAEAE